jgi:hypothetical protein
MFCIIDIIHHQHKVDIRTGTLNRVVSNRISSTGASRLAQNKLIPTASEANQESSITPYINLQSSDAYEEDQLDDNDNDTEQPEMTPNKQSTENESRFDFRDHRAKSNYLENLSQRSSAADVIRDVLSRRRALDPTEKHDLRTYIRNRKDSIVQHVIGYNYDDHSIVGGLYTRVGIGSKLNKNISVITDHLNGLF